MGSIRQKMNLKSAKHEKRGKKSVYVTRIIQHYLMSLTQEIGFNLGSVFAARSQTVRYKVVQI